MVPNLLELSQAPVAVCADYSGVSGLAHGRGCIILKVVIQHFYAVVLLQNCVRRLLELLLLLDSVLLGVILSLLVHFQALLAAAAHLLVALLFEVSL